VRELLISLLLAVPLAAQTTPPAAPQPAPEAPNVPLLAQMLDRCMATYAVRLSKTDMADEAIFAEARKGCAGIDQQLRAGVRSQLPAAEAEALFKQFDDTDRPNFMALLQRIRADRAARATPN
jgi:hypothetical protein